MIKKLEAEDLNDFKVWASHFKPEPSFNWTPETLLECFSTCEIWGFFLNGKLMSAVALQKNSASVEIIWLATLPEAQSQGYMGQLLGSLLNNAPSQSIPIHLEVHEKNSKARELYGRLGFKHVGTRKNYYKDGSSALLFTYSGPPKSS